MGFRGVLYKGCGQSAQTVVVYLGTITHVSAALVSIDPLHVVTQRQEKNEVTVVDDVMKPALHTSLSTCQYR
jgi:hypothetical protein